MPTLRAAALSDIGRVRRENEDRFILDVKGILFGVADGVGGLPGGAEAAQLAVEEVVGAIGSVASGRNPDLVRIIQRANEAVAALGRRISPSMGIGTTLTVGCVRDGAFEIGHVGDSRCYVHSTADGFMRLTEDHSVENEARMRRARGEVVYYHEANRNALTRCIGQPTPPDVDVLKRPLIVGERYLFCTDGVSRMIPDTELSALVEKSADPEGGLRDIIGLAVKRGGPDNATGVMVFVDAL
jgi:serine/threonine protein phosphatase PrpC